MLGSNSPSEQDAVGITVVLDQIRSGVEGAERRLYELVYKELRKQAEVLIAYERTGTLGATELVHEVYIRLTDGDVLARSPNRRYFFAAAGRAMRQILVDHARSRRAQKRGKNYERCPLDAVLEFYEAGDQLDILELDAALAELEQAHPRQYLVVLHRYFTGLTIAETASVLNMSVSSVEGDWRLARAKLYKQLRGTET